MSKSKLYLGSRLERRDSDSPGRSTNFDDAWESRASETASQAGSFLPGGSLTSREASILAELKEARSGRLSDLWKLNFKDLNIQKQIGEGSFGKVGALFYQLTRFLSGFCCSECRSVRKRLRLSMLASPFWHSSLSNPTCRSIRIIVCNAVRVAQSLRGLVCFHKRCRVKGGERNHAVDT